MKNQPENCENCAFFNNSKHKLDKRTEHAGICSKWSEIQFKNSTCKMWFSNENLPAEKIFKPLVDVSKLPDFNQLTLF